jgi:hypothetical protein
MDNVQEIKSVYDVKKNCVWKQKEYCKITEDTVCPEDCSLRSLLFDKDKIIERMKSEEIEIQNLKKDGMFKNKHKIIDLIMGLSVLNKCLVKEFDYKETVVVDKDFERKNAMMLKSMGRFK